MPISRTAPIVLMVFSCLTLTGCFLDWITTADDAWLVEAGHPTGIVQDSAGDYVVSTGSILRKLNADGNVLWQTGIHACDISGLCETSDGGYVGVGYVSVPPKAYNRITCLPKADADGVLVWLKEYPELSAEKGVALQKISDDGFVLAGVSENVHVVKVDAADGVARPRQYAINYNGTET